MIVIAGLLMGGGLLYLGLVVIGLGDRFHMDEALSDIGLAGLFGAQRGGATMALAAFVATLGAVGVVGRLTGRPGWAMALMGLAAGYGAARSVAAFAASTYDDRKQKKKEHL
jgi:hypothetical protein